MKMTLTGLLRKRPMVDTSLEPPVLSWVGLSAGCDWGPARAGPAVVPAAARRAGRWEDRNHDGTVEREWLSRQLQHLRRALAHQDPRRAGKQLEEGTHTIRLLRELRPAGLLTAG